MSVRHTGELSKILIWLKKISTSKEQIKNGFFGVYLLILQWICWSCSLIADFVVHLLILQCICLFSFSFAYFAMQLLILQCICLVYSALAYFAANFLILLCIYWLCSAFSDFAVHLLIMQCIYWFCGVEVNIKKNLKQRGSGLTRSIISTHTLVTINSNPHYQSYKFWRL